MDEKPDCLNDLDKVRHIEGFPLGTDEDICALSDPPYYTAYPNPHLADFIAKHGTLYDEATDDYHCEPFIGDIVQSRNEPIYYAHTYHTKVPYLAIASFIEHYTEPGNIVLDGFCGSGMTGIAAQITGRNAIICDLSPGTTFLARNYNFPLDLAIFVQETKRIKKQLSRNISWLYETQIGGHTNTKINFTVWSQVFVCPYCAKELAFWDVSIDHENKQVKNPFVCTGCSASLSKDECSPALDRQGKVKTVPVAIFAKVKGNRANIEKRPTEHDVSLLERIEESTMPYWYPTDRMPAGDEARRNDKFGITHVNHFFTKRNLWALSSLYELCVESADRFPLFLFTSLLEKSTVRSMTIVSNYLNKGRGGFAGKPMTGTLYVPAVQTEASVVEQLDARISSTQRFISALSAKRKQRSQVAITTQSVTDLRQLPNNVVDYIFIDPPFGENLMYSELNFIVESWLKVRTNNRQEAIINRTQGKKLDDYRLLMTAAFREMHRVLKPNRWITVEFHNSKASVWKAIQDGLSKAGFVVAQVVTLDKGRASFIQYSAMGSVKNDLVINAYKPQQSFVDQFLHKAGAGMERAFIKQHLGYLPIAANVERSREMLYSKMLAYYIQRGYEISLNSPQFYRLLAAEFVERDGYWFRDESQAQEYEQRKLDPGRKKTAGQGQGVLFISDERSAIAWLHHFLAAGPQTYSDLYTAYAKALQTSDDQIPELKQLLEETCVQVNGHWKRPDALTAEELETRRRDRLLRQFNEYLREATAGQRLTDVRKEAILTGFEEAYRAKRYEDITAVGSKLNRSLVDSSTEIFDFIDIAEAKLG
jgi:DNA modification methylase